MDRQEILIFQVIFWMFLVLNPPFQISIQTELVVHTKNNIITFENKYNRCKVPAHKNIPPRTLILMDFGPKQQYNTIFPHPPFDFTHFFFSNLGFKTITVRNENKERIWAVYSRRNKKCCESFRWGVRWIGGLTEHEGLNNKL